MKLSLTPMNLTINLRFTPMNLIIHHRRWGDTTVGGGNVDQRLEIELPVYSLYTPCIDISIKS